MNVFWPIWPGSYPMREWVYSPRLRSFTRRLDQPTIDDEPITLDQAKAHLRVGKPGVAHPEDGNIRDLIQSARAAAENYCNRAIAQATFEAKGFGFDLPLVAPLLSISQVKYLDSTGVYVALANTVYETGPDPRNPTIRLKVNQAWPSPYSREDAVVVTHVAGQDPDDVEPDIKHAIKLILGDMYDHREATLATPGVQPYEMPMGARFLLNMHRLGMGV